MDPFYIPWKIIPELNSKIILGFGAITDSDVQPSLRLL